MRNGESCHFDGLKPKFVLTFSAMCCIYNVCMIVYIMYYALIEFVLGGTKMAKRVSVAAMILCAVLLLAGCSGNASQIELEHESYRIGTGQTVTGVRSLDDVDATKQTDSRTLYLGAYGENFVTSTLSAVGYNNLIAISNIYDGLFAKDFKTGEVVCRIAESYEFIPDDTGVMLHIVIRENAHFQSGEPITAYDCFEATVGRVATVGTVRTYLGSSVDVENSYYDGERDLYIHLYDYDSTILECLSCQWLNISNKSFEDTASDEDLWDKVDGSGPFIVEEQISGDSVLLRVDDDYWGWGIIDERPNYDYLSVKFYTEASIMLIDYENGKLDACIGLSFNDTRSVMNNGRSNSKAKVVSSGNYTVICLPSYVEAFRDARVREAVFCAIDTDAAAKAAYGELGITMNSYVSSMSNYRQEYQTNRYDPERAKSLLAEAGYQPGELSLYTVVSSNDSCSVALAEIIQSFLDDVGIELRIDSYDFATAIQMQRNGTVDLCMTTFYTMNCDISGCLIQLPEGSYNKAAWVTQLDATMAEKLNAGRFADDTATAEAAYGWVQDWLHENMWYLPVVEYNTAFICRDYVDDSEFYNLMHVRDIRNLDLIAE